MVFTQIQISPVARRDRQNDGLLQCGAPARYIRAGAAHYVIASSAGIRFLGNAAQPLRIVVGLSAIRPTAAVLLYSKLNFVE